MPKCLHLFPVGWALGDITKSAHRTPQHCVDFPLQFLGKEGSWRHTKRHTGSKELSKAISFCKRGTSEPREGWWACSAQMTPVCYPWCKYNLTQLANWCKRRCVVHGIWVCGFLSTFDRKKIFLHSKLFLKGKIGVLYTVHKHLKPRLPAFLNRNWEDDEWRGAGSFYLVMFNLVSVYFWK